MGNKSFGVPGGQHELLMVTGVTEGAAVPRPPNPEALLISNNTGLIRSLLAKMFGRKIPDMGGDKPEEMLQETGMSIPKRFGAESILSAEDEGTVDLCRIPPSAQIERVTRELHNRGLVEVTTPELVDAGALIRVFRDKFFSESEVERFYNLIDFLRNSNVTTGKDYYDKIAMMSLYRGGRVPFENIAIMARTLDMESFSTNGTPYNQEILSLFTRFIEDEYGFVKPEVDKNGRIVPARVLDIATGNGDIPIRLNKLRNAMQVASSAEDLNNVISLAKLIGEYLDREKSFSKDIMALDFSSSFTEPLRRKRGIRTFTADICSDPNTLFDSTGLDPNSIDLFTGILFLDRVKDFRAAIDNIRRLARKNGTSRIVIGALLPFEHVGDAMNTESIGKIPFWEPEGDVRSRFMKNIPVSDEFNDMDEKFGKGESVRAQSIFNLVITLSELGIKVTTLGEQPYEVYSPHCIIEPAGKLRTDAKYAYLKDEKQTDPAIQDMIANVFSGEYPDDKIIGIPQRYERLLLLGGIVVPK